MNKINYVVIMLFMYMYSPVIYGLTEFEKELKEWAMIDQGLTEEEFEKELKEWEKVKKFKGLTEKELKKELEDWEMVDKEEEEEKLNESYSKGLIKTGESISNVSLSNFVKKIGEVISKSLCKDRAFTITPNIGLDGKRAPGFILLTHER